MISRRSFLMSSTAALVLPVDAKAAFISFAVSQSSVGPGPLAGVTLQAIDGESMLTGTTMSHNYYASNGYSIAASPTTGAKSWDDPTYFPIGCFYGIDAGQLAAALDLGINVSFAVIGSTNPTLFATNQVWGLPAVTVSTFPNTEIAVGSGIPGWVMDEPVHTDVDDGSRPGMQKWFTNIPGATQAGRIPTVTFTWGEIVGGSLSISTGGSTPIATLLQKNHFSSPNGPTSVGIVQTDIYWFGAQSDASSPPSTFGWQWVGFDVLSNPMVFQPTPTNATQDQMARGSNYGNMIDVMRSWGNNTNTGLGSSAFGKSAAPSRIPIFCLPDQGDTLAGAPSGNPTPVTAAQLNWAVWSSIIHGCRGLDYFTSTGFEGTGSAVYNQAKATNGLITSLANVLNSPFAKGYLTAVTPHGYIFPVYEGNWLNGGVEACVKWDGSNFYIFATTRESQTTTNLSATFTLNSNDTNNQATVIGEGRSVAIVGNQFTDTFATAATVHIYKIETVSLATPSMIQHTASAALFAGAVNLGSGPFNNFKFTLQHAVGAGNCLVLSLVYQHGQTPTITDNNTNTWPGSPTISADGGVGKFVSSIFVLPNAHAGVTQFTVSFGSGSTPFHYTMTEFNNIATVSPVNGTHGTANDAGPGLAAGAFTPTNNDVNGGNLIYSFFGISAYSTIAQNPTNWTTANAGSTLLDTDTAWTNVSGVPHASQYIQQTVAASINPGMTATGVSSDAYNCVAVALKVAAAGTARPAGIHIDRLIHQTTTQATTGGQAPSPLVLKMPMSGNLRVASITNAFAGSDNGGVTVTDSDGNTWTPVRAASNNAFFYKTNTSSNPNLTITITGLNSGGAGFSWYNSYRFYDISGASTSPFAGSATGTSSGSSPFTNQPSITPTGAPGVTLAWLGLNVAVPPITVSSPSNNILDVCQYTNQDDTDPMDNADGLAHLFHTTTAAQSWNWTETPAASPVWSVAVAFLTAQWYDVYTLPSGQAPSAVLDFVSGQYYDGTATPSSLSALVAGSPTTDANGLICTGASTLIAQGALQTALNTSSGVTVAVMFDKGNQQKYQFVITQGNNGVYLGVAQFPQNVFVYQDGGISMNFNAFDFTIPGFFAFGYSATAPTRSAIVNDQTPQQDNNSFTATTPTHFGYWGAASFPFFGRIRKLAVYPTRLTTSNLPSLRTMPVFQTTTRKAVLIRDPNGGLVLPTGVLKIERTQAWSAIANVAIIFPDTTNGHIVFTNVAGTPFAGYEIWIEAAGHVRVKIMSDNNGGNLIQVTGNTTVVTDGYFHTIAATYDGSSTAAGVKIYIDGVAEAVTINTDALTGSIVTIAGDMWLANQFGGGLFGLEGLMNFFTFSNNVRSLSYMASHGSYATKPVVDANTTLYYDFHEGSGTTVSDQSANNYTGTLQGTLGTDYVWYT